MRQSAHGECVKKWVSKELSKELGGRIVNSSDPFSGYK